MQFNLQAQLANARVGELVFTNDNAGGDDKDGGCLCCICVASGSRGIVQRFGKMTGIVGPGANCVCWPFSMVTPISIMSNQYEFNSESKTKDDVSVKIKTVFFG